MQALTEIARILQPTGVFGGIWNIDDCLSPLGRSQSLLLCLPKTFNSQRSFVMGHPAWLGSHYARPSSHLSRRYASVSRR
jgi:hypothetical protein